MSGNFTYLSVDLMLGSKKNMWLSPEKELMVRPGLQRVYAPSGSTVLDGFSVFNQATLESWHYIVLVNDTTGAVALSVFDEDWVEKQRLAIEAKRRPRVVTHAVIGEIGQLFISSPDFATIWGLVGGGVRVATKAASTTNLETVEIPRGVCARWANRVVFGAGNLLFVSDPVSMISGDGRSIVSPNILDVGAPIIGLHTAADDLLVAVTTNGVFAFPGEMTATALVAQGEGRRLRTQDYDGVTFGSSCEVKNKVYALSREGFRRVDAIDSPSVRISDERHCGHVHPRISFDDYRDFRLVEGPEGPIVSLPGLGYFLMTDVEEGFMSWWSLASGFGDGCHVVGTLRRSDGAALLLTEKGAYYIGGNFDAVSGSTTEQGTVQGSVAAQLPRAPAQTQVVRRALLHIDGELGCTISVRGESRTPTTPAPADGAIIGTAEWGDGQLERGFVAVREDLDTRTEDVALEFAISGQQTVVGRRADIALLEDSRLTT